MTPQERLDALRKKAAKEGKLDKLQEAVFSLAEQMVLENPPVWIKACDLKPGAKFIRRKTSGTYIKVSPAGPILNSSMVQDLLAHGNVFIVNLSAERTSLFFIKGDEDVKYL